MFTRLIRFSIPVIVAAFIATPGQAATINVITLDATNNFGGRSEDFAAGSLYSGLRGSLLDASNFGLGGTVTHSVNLLSAVDEFTAANLAPADVIIWSQRSGPSATERTAINGFLENGGGLMIVGDAIHSFSGLLGSTVTLGDFQGGFPTGTVTSSDNAISNGLFGDVRGNTLSVGAAFNLNSISDSNTFDALTATASGGATMEIAAFGDYESGGTVYSGRVAIFGDDDFLISQTGAAQYRVGGIEETLALNSFAFVANNAIAVPEPSSVLAGCMMLVGATVVRRRRVKS